MDIFLKANPQIATVYFNDKGEWSFSPHSKYPIEKSRLDILEEAEMAKAYNLELENDRLEMEAKFAEIKERKIEDLKAKAVKAKGKPDPMASFVESAVLEFPMKTVSGIPDAKTELKGAALTAV